MAIQAEIESLLYPPLVEHLLPLRRERLAQRKELGSVTLYREDWPDQYENGIDVCCGIKIKWIRKPLSMRPTVRCGWCGHVV